MFLGIELLHVCFVNLEWFYRYESYVVALGLLTVTFLVADAFENVPGWWRTAGTPVRRAALTVTLSILCLPLFTRALFALGTTVQASGEIYRQQYQMGHFFREHYAGETIALNDIGAVSWIAPVQVLDLIGLASNEIAHARRIGDVDAEYMHRITGRHRVAAAAIYESHFRAVGELPSSWIKVGEWRIPSAVGVFRENVAFFAPSPDHALRLRDALDSYARRLPRDVRYLPGGAAQNMANMAITTLAAASVNPRMPSSKRRNIVVVVPPHNKSAIPRQTTTGTRVRSGPSDVPEVRIWPSK
jgi:hypothetical protein